MSHVRTGSIILPLLGRYQQCYISLYPVETYRGYCQLGSLQYRGFICLNFQMQRVTLILISYFIFIQLYSYCCIQCLGSNSVKINTLGNVIKRIVLSALLIEQKKAFFFFVFSWGEEKQAPLYTSIIVMSKVFQYSCNLQ